MFSSFTYVLIRIIQIRHDQSFITIKTDYRSWFTIIDHVIDNILHLIWLIVCLE